MKNTHSMSMFTWKWLRIRLKSRIYTIISGLV